MEVTIRTAVRGVLGVTCGNGVNACSCYQGYYGIWKATGLDGTMISTKGAVARDGWLKITILNGFKGSGSYWLPLSAGIGTRKS